MVVCTRNNKHHQEFDSNEKEHILLFTMSWIGRQRCWCVQGTVLPLMLWFRRPFQILGGEDHDVYKEQ